MPITLEEPRYEAITVRGETFEMQVNPPLRIIAALESGAGDRIIPALEQIVRTHPVVDAAGKSAAIEDFGLDLANEIATAWGEHLRALPKASAGPSERPGSRRRR